MMTQLEELSREELVDALRAAQTEAERISSDIENERVVHDLRVYQIQLEMQNRELREAQAQLEESRCRYADLYDFAPIAYCTLDKDGRVLEANLTTTAYFGVDRSALVGKPLAMLAVPDDRPLLRSHLKRCIQESSRVTSELRLTGQNLGPTMFQLVSTPVRRADGPPLICRTAITDISSLKRSEERLRLLAQVSATLGNSFDVHANLATVVRTLVPAFGDFAFADLLAQDGEVKRVEVSAGSTARLSVAEAMRRPPIPWSGLTEAMLVNDDPANVLTHVLPETPDRPALVEACRARSVILAPMLARERPVGLLVLISSDMARRYLPADLAFAQDIAARAAMAVDNARLYHAAEHATQARQDMLSIVSHELKNPLTAITLSADVMIKAAPPEERRKGRRHLERIKRGVSHMRRMIEDLLDLSSLESGHLSVERGTSELTAIADEAIDLLAPLAHDKQLSLLREPGPPIAAKCDKNRTVQVLSNLISNAIKFTPENGAITVSVTHQDGKARVDVHDTGPGVPKQVMLHLFERFWQARETAAKGRGLGLYIAKGIIEAMGGTIWVESNPKRGTTFSFTLDRAEVKPVARQEKAPGGVVMVVDDDDDIRELVADVLQESAYAVVQAANGDQALKYLRSGLPQPRLMLLDLTMPVMDGRELMGSLKKDAALSRIPVVLVSSVTNLDEEVLTLGAQGSLMKPIDIDRLLKVVSTQAGLSVTA